MDEHQELDILIEQYGALHQQTIAGINAQIMQVLANRDAKGCLELLGKLQVSDLQHTGEMTGWVSILCSAKEIFDKQ